MSEHSVELVKRWRAGDERAAEELYHAYQERLLGVVARHLGEKLRGPIGAEDLVQSILKSMFRVTREKNIEFSDDSGFWKWLVTIALNKTFRGIQRAGAGKRDFRRELRDTVLTERETGKPSVSEVSETADLLECILVRLEPDEQQTLLLKLEGYQQTEIAKRLNVCEKTVQRLSHRIREVARQVTGDEAGPPLE